MSTEIIHFGSEEELQAAIDHSKQIAEAELTDRWGKTMGLIGEIDGVVDEALKERAIDPELGWRQLEGAHFARTVTIARPYRGALQTVRLDEVYGGDGLISTSVDINRGYSLGNFDFRARLMESVYALVGGEEEPKAVSVWKRPEIKVACSSEYAIGIGWNAGSWVFTTGAGEVGEEVFSYLHTKIRQALNSKDVKISVR